MNHDLRLLRRDLHDSIGPLLAAVTMRTQAARELITSDPETARRMLGDLHADACYALAEVRRLASPAVQQAGRDTGLAAALRHQAERFHAASGGGLRISVAVAAGTAAAPVAVQDALYRIATEALTNTARHACATRCAIRVWAGDDGFHLEVTDNGTGLPRRAGGVGLRSMRDRAAEIGGTCVVGSCVPHGTRVYAMFPAEQAGHDAPGLPRPAGRVARHPVPAR